MSDGLRLLVWTFGTIGAAGAVALVVAYRMRRRDEANVQRILADLCARGHHRWGLDATCDWCGSPYAERTQCMRTLSAVGVPVSAPVSTRVTASVRLPYPEPVEMLGLRLALWDLDRRERAKERPA